MNSRVVSVAILVIVLLFTVQTAFATNGMNMIGYGARMSAMGGASFAMNNDTHLMNTNPAGISTITGQQLDLSLGLLMPSVHFENELNNLDADSETFPLPSFGYVYNQADSKFAFGIGFYAQGGMGATYNDVKHDIFCASDGNPTTQDDHVGQEYHSNIGYMKLAPTVAYQFTPDFSIGFALNFGYAQMEMQMPYSLPPSAMLGEVPGGNGMTFGDMFGAPMEQGGLDFDEVTAYADMDDAVTATGWGGKLGIQYKVTDKLRVGASYTMKSTLDFSGEAGMDMTAQFNNAYERMVMGALVQMSQDGVVQDPMNPTEQELQMAQQGVMQQLSDMGIDMSLGMKAMYDVDIDFSWPQEFGFGVAYAPNDRLIIATDVHWINWEDTMKEFVMHFSNGDNSNINTMMGTPDGSMTLEMPMNWDNQLVVAMGLEFWATPNLAVRTGFNYAKNPVPAETVIPIFPAIVENHLTFGLGYNFNGMFQVDMAYEKVFANELESNGSTIANEYNSCTNELGEDVVHMSGTLRF